MEGSLCEVAAVRLDAGFPDEELLSGLEVRGIPYVARIRNNPVLDRMAAPHLKRPGGGRHCGGSWLRSGRWPPEFPVSLSDLDPSGGLILGMMWLVR